MKKRVVILASGQGTTFQHLVEASRKQNLGFEIAALVVDRPNIGVIDRANKMEIPFYLVKPEDLLDQVQKLQPDLIVLTGYFRKIPKDFIDLFYGRIINSHPSLLPKYGGKGMYGPRIHQAVFAAKEKETGVSIHLVNENFDEGPIVAQKKIDIENCQSADEIEDRVKQIEKGFLCETLFKIANSEIIIKS